MKSLIQNYIDKLDIDTINKFLSNHSINLNESELKYIFNLIKNNYEDILVNENKYLNDIKNHLNEDNYNKINDLIIDYKNRYKGYLF